jgi:hypothetical protein
MIALSIDISMIYQLSKCTIVLGWEMDPKRVGDMKTLSGSR